jgi:hypothetical protein
MQSRGSEVATDIISESMGHQNVAVTRAYLKELDNSLIDEAMEVLLSFVLF